MKLCRVQQYDLAFISLDRILYQFEINVTGISDHLNQSLHQTLSHSANLFDLRGQALASSFTFAHPVSLKLRQGKRDLCPIPTP